MKTKSDVSAKLASLNSNASLNITDLIAIINSNQNIIVFFDSPEISSHIIFDASESRDVMRANTLINHFNTHPDKRVTMYYSGVLGEFTADRISLLYMQQILNA